MYRYSGLLYVPDSCIAIMKAIYEVDYEKISFPVVRAKIVGQARALYTFVSLDRNIDFEAHLALDGSK